MTRLSRHVRLIYLFALFQVLGGPALLCGVIGLVRLASDQQLTLAEHATRAIERVQRREQGLPEKAIVRREIPREDTQPAVPAPPQQKDEGKTKFTGIIETFKSPRIGSSAPGSKHWCRHDPALIEREHPPLLPPPRLG